MYELRSAPNKKPISFSCYEEAKAVRDLVKHFYGVELEMPEFDQENFDISTWKMFFVKHSNIRFDEQTGEAIPRPGVDVVILGKDLANFEEMDYSELLKPYIETNQKLVDQYKAGNDKALNALMGKFLKDNKGHDAKAIKEALEKIL